VQLPINLTQITAESAHDLVIQSTPAPLEKNQIISHQKEISICDDENLQERCTS
jgi:hypothetical protein